MDIFFDNGCLIIINNGKYYQVRARYDAYQVIASFRNGDLGFTYEPVRIVLKSDTTKIDAVNIVSTASDEMLEMISKYLEQIPVSKTAYQSNGYVNITIMCDYVNVTCHFPDSSLPAYSYVNINIRVTDIGSIISFQSKHGLDFCRVTFDERISSLLLKLTHNLIDSYSIYEVLTAVKCARNRHNSLKL